MDLTTEPCITEALLTSTVLPFLEVGGARVTLGDISGTAERVQRMLASLMDAFPAATIEFTAEPGLLHPCLARRVNEMDLWKRGAP